VAAQSVPPGTIEEVLHEHPTVQEAAVIGIPHPQLEEEIGAASPLNPADAIADFELSDYMKANVAANKYSYSRHVRFVSELPNGPTGKILKRQITLAAELAGAATGGV
jgi:long-chain acyl-CoA synthetase